MINNNFSHVYVQHAFSMDFVNKMESFLDNKYNENNQDTKIDSVRSGQSVFIDNLEYKQLLMEHINTINDVYGLSWDLTDIEDLQYSHYNEKGYSNWHSDTRPGPYSDNAPEVLQGKIRKLSIILQVNDKNNFVGGEIEIVKGLPNEKDHIKEITLNKGDMLVFPSFVPHRVKSIDKGIRKALVGWVIGPPFK